VAIILPIVALLIFFNFHDQSGVADVAASPAVPADSLNRQLPNDSFGPGELLKFNIGYGFVTAGTATLEVRDTSTVNGALCFQIYSETNSNKFFDGFYKVRDTIICQLDAEGLFSRYFFKALHEGSYHSSRKIEFEYDQRRAITYKGTDKVDTLAISAFSQDVLTAFYYIRTLPLEVGQTIKLNYVDHDSATVMEVRILKRETVDVPAGQFKCIVVEPMLQAAGVFKQEGEVKVWLTDDRLKMPVLMKSKVLVGSIYAELTEFKLGNLNW
jgi:hypothetical protein